MMKESMCSFKDAFSCLWSTPIMVSTNPAWQKKQHHCMSIIVIIIACEHNYWGGGRGGATIYTLHAWFRTYAIRTETQMTFSGTACLTWETAGSKWYFVLNPWDQESHDTIMAFSDMTFMYTHAWKVNECNYLQVLLKWCLSSCLLTCW